MVMCARCIIESHGDSMAMCLRHHTVCKITNASSSRITIERFGLTYSEVTQKFLRANP